MKPRWKTSPGQSPLRYVHPRFVLFGGVALAGLFVAYEVWGRSPGDKAKVGDVVRVDAKDVALTPGLAQLFPGGLPPGTFIYVLINAIDPSTGRIQGRVVRVQLPDRAVELKNVQVFVTTTRRAVLPLAYGAPPVPTTTL